MMSDKKPTVAALQRKIERLEAQIAALEAKRQHSESVTTSQMWRMVEAECRIAQAVRLLQGEDV